MSQQPTTCFEQIDSLLEDLETATNQLEATHSKLESLRRTPENYPITIQWTPTHSPPRQLTFERTTTGWIRAEYEWTGTGWRPCGSEPITDPAITSTRSLPEPADPPSLEELLEYLTESPTHALVFEQTPSTDTSVVIAIDDELRFRSLNGERWHPIDATALQQHLQQYGQPTLTHLEDTPVEYTQFTSSPLDLHAESESH